MKRLLEGAMMQGRSARDDAIRVIEALQKRYNPQAKEIDEEFLKRFVSSARKSLNLPENFEDEYITELQNVQKTMFSKYEEPAWFSIVSDYSGKIETAIRRQNPTKQFKKVLFGTLETGRINGMAIGIDNPEYCVVLLETGLFGFANLLAKGVAHALPVKNDDSKEGLAYSTDISDIEERLRTNEMLVLRIVDLVISYIVAGHPHAARPYLPEQKYHNLTSLWRSVIEYFVLAHEYGHVFAGHLDGSVQAQEATEIPTSWEQEFEADYIGLVTTLNILIEDRFMPSLTYCGIEAFFLGVELIERVLAIFQERPLNKEGTATHPPANMRREMMRMWLQKGMESEESQAAIEMADTLGRILDLMWPQIEIAATNFKKAGAVAHIKWSNY